MPKTQAYCWVCGTRPKSSLCRPPPDGLSLKAPGSPKHGKTPKWCYLGECQAMGEAQQASKAANDREAKLMAEKAAAPVAKRTRLGLGTTWQPKVSNNRAILVRFVIPE